ncbi:TonB-dependent receptor [Carboxylicivirga linearis]|uniref:TonB-dependent receptor n=1 Tax=Carboxylicivirga linearis TaxID=1628157 RepID=A0ABS5JRH1_9BACT|nr:hypothetical protein [Carboxylicivirga linearis]MBS2097491.1 hypothetical protein [Carboxylicivirga linearis]
MKKNLLIACLAMASIANGIISYGQENKAKSKDQSLQVDSLINKKEEKNRNVMLNAENNTGPRNVNIGLPFQGDIVILENDVPVVFNFVPTIPTSAWRMDNSLQGLGLLSFSEGALTWGKVGFAVKSDSRDASRKFKGFANVYSNSFGSSRYDLTVTGPFNKNGWGYMLSMYQNYDRGNGYNHMYTPWNDRTQQFKAAITKQYKKGSVRLLYKYVDNKSFLFNYGPIVYKGDGETEAMDGFRPGKDSYYLRSGMYPHYNPWTGEKAFADMTDDEMFRSQSHNIYITGDHKFDNGWKLKYTTMYQDMNTPLFTSFPVSLMVMDPDQYQQQGASFTYYGTDVPYDGSIQWTYNQLIPQSENKSLLSRVEFTKKVNNHSLRFGLTSQYNSASMTTYKGMMIHTVEANPQLLDYHQLFPPDYLYPGFPGGNVQITDGGLMPGSASGYGDYNETKYLKTAFYFSDDMRVTSWLDFGLGVRLEHQNKHEVNNPYINEIIGDKPLVENDFNNKLNKVFTANAVVKLSDKFGLVGDATYNSWYDSYWDFTARDENGNPIAGEGEDAPRRTVPNDFETNVQLYSGGVYFNLGKKLSIVSKVTNISKNKIKSEGMNITNPDNPNERQAFDPIFYDINTFGWTTDIVTSPFKNFNLHLLVTLQKPEYRNFSYSAFNVTYDYSNNIIPELSQTLLEIDPSYTMMKGKLKAWVSLRYFGKQYGNQTNAFSYNAWWENFGGLQYRMSRKVNLKFQVTNFLDQAGIRGSVQGAAQITSDQNYVNRKIVAGAIRPRTLEMSVDFKF